MDFPASMLEGDCLIAEEALMIVVLNMLYECSRRLLMICCLAPELQCFFTFPGNMPGTRRDLPSARRWLMPLR